MVAALLSGISGGAGGALVFHGDMGIGKTALVQFAVGAAAGFTVLPVTGCEAEAGVPFAALHHLLEVLAGNVPESLSEEALRLARVLEEGTDGGLGLSARVFGLFRLATREGPLLCAVDDAHWLDEPSLDVLAFVARRVRGERIGVLFACGDGGSISGIPVHRLAPLGREASLELARTVVPAPDVSAVVAETAKGNPRALLELAASLTPGQLRGDLPVPRTLPPHSGLRRAYRARLDRLPAGTRWLVLLAAADEQSGVDTLARAAAAGGVDITALEPAEAAGLVRVEGTTVVFGQPLLRAVAYHEATLAQRVAAHRCLAQAVDPGRQPLRHVLHRAAAANGPDDRLAAELERTTAGPVGDHATWSRALARAADLTSDADTAATRLVAAARHAWHAGERARARSLVRRIPSMRVSVAVQAQSRVLAGEIELRAGLADTACHTLLAAAGDLAARDRYLALGAFMRAGEALCLSGGYSRYPDLARQALALRRSDEPAGVQSMFDHFAALSATFRGDHSRAIGPSRRLLAAARTLGDTDTLTRASLVAIFRGDQAQAHLLATRATRTAEADGDLSALPQAMEAATLAEFALGRYDDATRGLDGIRLARESGQDNLAGNCLALLAALAAMTGDRENCLLRLRETATYVTGHGISRAKAFGDWALAALDLADGRYPDVVARLRGLATDRDGSGHLIVRVAATPHLVEAAVRCGRRAIAAETLKVYDSWAGSTGGPHWLALSARCHALLTDNAAEAEARFRDALGQHMLATGEFELARTELLLGQHLRRHRKPKAAREPLHDALSTFERFGASRWAERATAELRAAGHQVPPRGAGVVGTLTPHQLRIARLVAEGATNREVAARMLISTRTVDHHLRNIFAKLGVRSRVELAKLMT
jgi:DNA-binding CsgD family transcriptional regulator